jgi:hypothetical protein
VTNPADPEPGEIRDPDLAAAEGEVDRKQGEEPDVRTDVHQNTSPDDQP